LAWGGNPAATANNKFAQWSGFNSRRIIQTMMGGFLFAGPFCAKSSCQQAGNMRCNAYWGAYRIDPWGLRR
jgi:hypothetical protein